jgi:hypothetical protein
MKVVTTARATPAANDLDAEDAGPLAAAATFATVVRDAAGPRRRRSHNTTWREHTRTTLP